MALSADALSAVEAIRRELKVRVSLNTIDRYYDSLPKLKFTVELLMADEVISKDTSYVDVPS